MAYRQASAGIARTGKIDWPQDLLAAVKAKAVEEDENLSSLIRKVMAAYVGWEGPTRNIRNYAEGQS